MTSIILNVRIAVYLNVFLCYHTFEANVNIKNRFETNSDKNSNLNNQNKCIESVLKQTMRQKLKFGKEIKTISYTPFLMTNI